MEQQLSAHNPADAEKARVCCAGLGST